MLKKTDYNAKISKIESKIPSVSGLATKSALTAVENKIPDVSKSANNTDSNTKISEIEKKFTDLNQYKYITNPEFNNLAAGVCAARLTQANLVTKTDFDTRLIILNKKINSNETKHFLVENELKKLETFHSSYFRGKNYFEEGGTQNSISANEQIF